MGLRKINKKGEIESGIVFIVTIAALAFLVLIAGYIGYTVSNELKDKIGITAEINKSLQTTTTISTITLSTIWYIFFGGLLFGLLLTSFFAREYPKVMLPIFILTLIVSILVSIVISDAYDLVYNTAELSTISSYQYGIYFIMTKLPYLALIAGLISIIIMFTRGGGSGGGGAIIN
jgi:hypothetical protein